MSISWLKKLFHDTSDAPDAPHETEPVPPVDHGEYLHSQAPFRPCHYFQLFVKSNGDVFPCCDSVGHDQTKIGHITDKDLNDKITSFDGRCSCHKYRLRKGTAEETKNYEHLNLEMALTCQARCIMCIVDAPGWKGSYDYYQDLELLIENITPKELFVQGGEILIQKKALSWLRSIRQKYPGMLISLGTNGNVSDAVILEIEGVFDRFSISFVGFQEETYKKIMGIDIQQTFNFVDSLLRHKSCQVQLKYLITPVNLHETGLFLKWALSMSPERIFIADAATVSYINLNTRDEYWLKIIELVGTDIREAIVSAKDKILTDNIVIALEERVRSTFGIDKQFADAHGLSRHVVTHRGWSPSILKTVKNFKMM